MATEKAAISEKIQMHIDKAQWKQAIAEMENLFAVDPDPIVRVRIGDAHQKLKQNANAVAEYVRAGELFAEKGFVVKALALYKLALRLDPTSKEANEKMAALHSNKTVTELKIEPLEFGTPAPQSSIIPLFSDLTQEEFNDFTKRMTIHTAAPGKVIIREGEAGSSVFVTTRGSVKVYTTIQGKQVELAVLQPSDFFGEIAFLTGKPRTATVEAVEESELLEVSEEDLLDLIAKQPRIKEVLQKYHAQRAKSTLEKVKSSV